MTLNNDSTTGVLKLSGTLDIDGADSLREALLDCLLHQSEIAVNLESVDGCDTAALQILLAAQKNASEMGKPFRLDQAPEFLTDTAVHLGLPIAVRGD